MRENFKIEIPACKDDLRIQLFYSVLLIAGQVFLFFVLDWHIIPIIVFALVDLSWFVGMVRDWLYFGRSFILDECGCTVVSKGKSQKYAWEDIYLQHTKNTSFTYGDSEIAYDGYILALHPISKPKRLGAMTYCRYTHPRTSVFLRFASTDVDRRIKTAGKVFLRGFVIREEELYSLLKHIEHKPAE